MHNVTSLSDQGAPAGSAGWSLKSTSVRGKLFLLIGTCSFFLIALGAFFLTVLDQVKVSGPIYASITREMDLQSDILPPPEFIVETHLTVLRIQSAMRSNPGQVQSLLIELASLQHDYYDRQQYWSAELPSSTPLEENIRQVLLTESKQPADKYFQIVADEFLPAVKRGDPDAEAKIVDGSLAPLYAGHKLAILKLVDLTNKSKDLRVQGAVDTIKLRITLSIVAIVCSLLLLFAGGIYIASSISSPLKNAVAALETVAQRDLTPHLDVTSSDEIGVMSGALNAALSAIRGGFGEADEIAHVVFNTSTELDAAAQSLASGSQLQAANLEEASACLEQVTATIKLTADHANEASGLASAASATAANGNEVVASAIRAMTEISQASSKIGEITGNIDEIAFHTNILAINAAVEAARAGEMGRGFAVVAQEVRSLSQRTTTSAREIRVLIRDTIEKIERGSEFVRGSGETFEAISTSVVRVAQVMREISNACSEQSIAMESVNIGVNQVQTVVQSSATRGQELTAISTDLHQRAEELLSMVSRFKIADKKPVLALQESHETAGYIS